MTADYDFAAIQRHWRQVWDRLGPRPEPGGPRRYLVDMFAYPSGDLHMGHAEAYAIGDALARYWTLRGYHVLHPVGWDSFGLPAENAAIRRDQHPADWTYANIATQAESFRRYAVSVDWWTRLHTSDPSYYRWTQWLFLRFFEHGLAYRQRAEVNWCPADQTVLANEQVIGGRCERCGTEVTRRSLIQWFFRITAYADRLLDDMAALAGHWPPHVLTMQRNWIGREEGPAGVTYRLHDWLVSRQRFWGCPIPIVHCPACGEVPVPDDQLPVRLPDLRGAALLPRGAASGSRDAALPPRGAIPAPRDVTPTPPGVSPLAAARDWVEVECPRCGRPAERDTDTMDTFVDSSWYFLRYPAPDYADGPFDPAEVRRWLPVDQYVGGGEHATLHLLYVRFFTKVLKDLGLIDFDEPFRNLLTQGQVILNGAAMSKSKGNMVHLGDQLDAYGVDAIRLTMLFAGPPQEDIDWADVSPAGAVRFLTRALRLTDEVTSPPGSAIAPGLPGESSVASGLSGESPVVSGRLGESSVGSGLSGGSPAVSGLSGGSPVASRLPGEAAVASSPLDAAGAVALRRTTHRLLRTITELIEARRLNVAVARTMELVSAARKAADEGLGGDPALREAAEAIAVVLSLFAPYTAEEMWSRLGHEPSVAHAGWPAIDPALAAAPTVVCAIQVNGKLRDRLEVPGDISAADLEARALASPAAGGRPVIRTVVRPPKLVNLVVPD